MLHFPAVVAFPATLHKRSPATTFTWILTEKADSSAPLQTDSSVGICNLKRSFQTLSWRTNLSKREHFEVIIDEHNIEILCNHKHPPPPSNTLKTYRPKS